MRIRLAIVNDYEVVVRGIAEMLAGYPEIEIVELDARVDVSQPVDIALFDSFAQRQGDSVDAQDLIENPLVDRVVIYTWNLDRPLVEASMALGAAAYLSKTLSGGDLVAALRAVMSGQRVVSDDPGPEVETTSGNWPGRAHGLTARESEVVALVTQGLSNAEIAERAALSINSVKTYIRSAYRKMGVTSRTNAVLWGIEHGFAPDRVRVRRPSPEPLP